MTISARMDAASTIRFANLRVDIRGTSFRDADGEGSQLLIRSDLRAKLIDVASRGRTVNYLELGAGRAMIGRYLARIAAEEALAGRPPLTSIVIRKDSRLPGEGFIEAMEHVGYIESASGADERTVWEQALRETHEYWRPKLGDDMHMH